LKELPLARKRSPQLTEAELRLMDVLWDSGSATVAAVTEALPKYLGLAYNTALTTMRILEDKGYLAHTKAAEGSAFVYPPAAGRPVRGIALGRTRRAGDSAVGKLADGRVRRLGAGVPRAARPDGVELSLAADAEARRAARRSRPAAELRRVDAVLQGAAAGATA